MSALRLIPLVCLALVPAACSGSGSDIGPVLPRPPADTFTISVVDTLGRPVSGVLATLSASGGSAGSGQAGRIEFVAPPQGNQLLFLAADNATATGVEQFPDLNLRIDVGGGHDALPRPVVLPDLTTAGRATLPAGSQASTATLASGAVSLTIPAGTLVATTGSATTVTVALAQLAAEDLPLPLPAASGGVWLSTRAAWLQPRDLVVLPGAFLSLPNDLNLRSGDSATLFRLDPTQGAWQAVGTVQPDLSNQLTTVAPTVSGGGIYCAAAVVSATASVQFRVLTGDRHVVAGALVAGPGSVSTLTDGNGQASLFDVPAQDAGGASVQLSLALTTSRGYRPARGRVALTATAGGFAVADQTLDTAFTGTIQVLGIYRAAAVPLRRVRVGGPRVGTLGSGLLDEDGRITFPDMELGIYDARFEGDIGHPFEILRGLQRGTLTQPAGNLDLELFGQRVNPRQSNALRFASFLVTDADGGGAVEGARLHLIDALGNQRDLGTTNEFGSIGAGGVHLRDVIASFDMNQDGRHVISAFTVARIDNVRIELPVLRVARSPGGPFAPFATAAGDLNGGVGGTDLWRIDGFAPINQHDWRSAVLEGRSLAFPFKRTDPGVAAGRTQFRIGVPAGRADLVAQRATLSGSDVTLTALGALTDLRLPVGDALLGAPVVGVAVNVPHTLTGLVPSLDPRIPASSLRLDLGAVRPGGRALDLARQLAGNLSVSGNDLVALLPAGSGFLTGAAVLGQVSGSATQGGVTRSQGVLFSGDAPATDTHLPPVPEILAPGPGALVAASGFDVQWTPPAGVSMQLLEILAQSAGETLRWQVLLPPDQGTYTFPALINNPPRPLVAGRTYTLTVRGFFVTEGFAAGLFDEYQRLVGTFPSMARSEQGVTAVSSASLQVVTQ